MKCLSATRLVVANVISSQKLVTGDHIDMAVAQVVSAIVLAVSVLVACVQICNLHARKECEHPMLDALAAEARQRVRHGAHAYSQKAHTLTHKMAT